MYMKVCDRCGKQEEVTAMFPFPTGNNESSRYTIAVTDGEKSRMITLCKDCEKDLDAFIQNERR